MPQPPDIPALRIPAVIAAVFLQLFFMWAPFSISTDFPDFVMAGPRLPPARRKTAAALSNGRPDTGFQGLQPGGKCGIIEYSRTGSGAAQLNLQRYRSGYNGPDSKSGVPAMVPWVRIPPAAPRRSEIRSTPFQGGPFWGRLKTAFRSFAPPFQLEPAALGFELVFGA